ncbi:hypothetical protein A5756_09665 [Mycobacterium sp. 852002-53434_SCH5985345]|uniref:hypothetical protein n=1 Tax=unclassified Mycobacterium TaxID=2642494 RepID=UPI000800B2D3|nr:MULTISPECIES: hypothetical protein [unclassified Mycobacterium]OBF57235.1 hypothetical protein A5756_09665 [Mycobacterium sp. 852002-53434_SCH5985345]OBF95741.1 hypothetical protein A5773_14055 [Mycobacterium sp. 852014-52450_SCH5900713]
MRALLEFFLVYFDFLYLDPRYRITDSETAADGANASLTLTGPTLTWALTNERGQMQIAVAPTHLLTPRNWFWVSLIKQYLDKEAEIRYLPAPDESHWMRENGDRVEQLFSDASNLEAICDDIKVLRRSNANTYWSTWRKQQGLN